MYVVYAMHSIFFDVLVTAPRNMSLMAMVVLKDCAALCVHVHVHTLHEQQRTVHSQKDVRYLGNIKLVYPV